MFILCKWQKYFQQNWDVLNSNLPGSQIGSFLQIMRNKKIRKTMVNAERAHVSSSLTRFADFRSFAKLYSYQYKNAQEKKRRAWTFKPIANSSIKRIANCSLASCTDLRLYHLQSGRWVFNHGASKFHIFLSQECLSLQFPENILVALCLRLRASRQRVRPRRRRAILMRR